MASNIHIEEIDRLLASLTEEGEEGGEIGFRQLELYPQDRSMEAFVPLYMQFSELVKTVKNAEAKSRLDLALAQFGDTIQKAYSSEIGFAPDFVLPPVFNQYKL